MDMSAFDILIVPISLTTLGSCAAGAAILGLMNAIVALADRVGRMGRPFEAAPRAGRGHRRRIDRRAARGVASVG
jgi:hypothetical protein